VSVCLSLYVQAEFLKQKSSSFFLRDLWISRLLLAACDRTEAIYLDSISLKLGTYTKFLRLLLLRYATMPLSLPPPLPNPAFPPVRLPASQPATDQTSTVTIGSATAGAKAQRSHNEKYKTRQLSDDPCIMSPSSSSCNLTYYRKEQAQV
jgi:hypothetical protein